MGDIFVHSGEDSDNVVAPTPQLQGMFVPGIDVPDIQDGFGLITPLGGGVTARQYTQYGISNITSPQETQLHDLTINPAEGQTFNFEGLVGPQGIPGTPGIDGITTLLHIYGAPNSNFLTALPHNIDQINQLGTAGDRLIYTSAYGATNNFVWTKTDIVSDVKSWNDSGINTDGSFLIVAADAGIYVSTDDGDTWNKYNPDADNYIQVNCQSSGGKAVVLGETERTSGTIWTTIDYGVNWVKKTVEITEGSASTKESQSSSSANNSITASTFWVTQTWTTVSAYSMTGVRLYLSRGGAFVGNVTISLRATDGGGKPTGGDLASVTFDGSILTTSSSGDGIIRNFDSPYSLNSGIKYAFVLRHDGIGYQNLRYRRASAGAYSGGAIHVSSDSGGTWGDASTQDIKFYIQGIGVESASLNSLWLGSAGNFLVTGAENGVILSTDFGANWTKKLPDGVGTTDWTKGICSSDGTYIIVVSDANAIYRSANSGTAWAAITPAGGDTFSVNKMATSDDGQFMVIVGQNSTDATESCYISTDYGATWTAKKPIVASIEWTDCDISNDGAIIAVSTTSYFYISFDSGATWMEQGMASTAEVWEGLSISGDGTTGLVANTNDNDEFFIGINTVLYSEATWAESALTSAGRALLDDADATAQATTLGLGTGDSPQFTGIELGHATDTTITRVSAGVIAVEGVNVMMVGGTPTAHTITSHSDVVDATGAELETLTGGGDVGALHTHAAAYQPLDAGLTSLAGLTYVSDSFIKVTAEDTYAIRTLVEVRTDLGLVIGTNVQAWDAQLDDLATITATAVAIDSHLGGHSDTVLWSEVDKTVSSIADITTKNHTDLTAGDGSDHTFINQNVTTTGTPTFAQVTIDNIVINNNTIAGGGSVVNITSNDDVFINSGDLAKIYGYFVDITSTGTDIRLTSADDVDLVATDKINFFASNNTSDYIQILTVTNVPQIATVGACNLTIAPDGGTTNITGILAVSSTVTWDGGGSANANTAFGWGDHASGGYAQADQTFYIGTTQVAINRASSALTLAGITLSGAGNITGTDVDISAGTGDYTSTGNITLTGGELNLIDDSATINYGTGGVFTLLYLTADTTVDGTAYTIFGGGFANTLAFGLAPTGTTFTTTGFLNFQTSTDTSASALKFQTDSGGILLQASTVGKEILFTTPQVRINADLVADQSIFVKEIASADTDRVGYGQLWTKDNAGTTELWFTDDNGNDNQVAYVV